MAQKLRQQRQSLSGTPQPNFINYQQDVIKANRAPSSGDTGYDLGQLWLDKSASVLYALVDVSAGVATWTSSTLTIVGGETIDPETSGGTVTLNPSSGGYPITPFVSGPVFPNGHVISGYNSVTNMLAAVDNLVGPFFFAMQGGWYVENVNFTNSPYPINVHLWGVIIASKSNIQGVALQGVQTIQTDGQVYFENINLINGNASDNCIEGDGSGGLNSILYFKNCNFEVTDGYSLYLPNWSGNVYFDSCGLFGVNFIDGWIESTGGTLNVFVKDSILGSSTTRTANLQGGTITLYDSTFNCPINFKTGCTVVAKNCIFYGGITLSGDATGQFDNCVFETGSTAAITMSSSASIKVSNSVIDSSNNPAIAGAGAGTLTLDSISFRNNANIAGTLTVSMSPADIFGEVRSGADTGGAAGFTSLTKTNSTTIGAGTGTVKMSNGNNADNAAWIKIYVGTTAYWIPAWTTNTP